MEPETIGAIAGGAAVALHIGGTWIREYRKHRTWRTNGSVLKEIKEDVKEISEKQGEQGEKMASIVTSVNAQKTQCKTTVSNFNRGMELVNQELLNIAKNRRK